MCSKILIKIASKTFELELDNFDTNTRQEIVNIFGDKELEIHQILRGYIQKIQENQEMRTKISHLIEKIDC